MRLQENCLAVDQKRTAMSMVIGCYVPVWESAVGLYVEHHSNQYIQGAANRLGDMSTVLGHKESSE